MMRKPCAQHAYFAGSGDVNQVGPEALERLGDLAVVSRKGGVEAQILFDGKGEKAARQLERCTLPSSTKGCGAVAGADPEKRQVAAAGEGLELAAGVGDAVDFMERVGEVSYAGRS